MVMAILPKVSHFSLFWHNLIFAIIKSLKRFLQQTTAMCAWFIFLLYCLNMEVLLQCETLYPGSPP